MASDQQLDSYLDSYTEFNDWLIKKRYERLKHYYFGTTCLEMGCADGVGTENLLNFFEDVTIVDGSKKAIVDIVKRLHRPNLKGMVSYFENMDLGKKRFNTIILAHVLEHVDTPRVVLQKAMRYLEPGGSLIIDVPNGNSLHRQLGVKMGMLKAKTDLNQSDLSIGHQRVYTPESFKSEIRDVGLEISHFGGMFIKLLSNKQTETTFSTNQLDGLFELGEEYPDIAAEIYIIAKLKK